MAEVLVHRLELLAQRDEVIGAAHEPSEEAGELDDQHPRRLGVGPDQGRDRRERVEQEVRADLAGQRLDARREQQLLLFLEPVLDARVVPDLDGDGHREHRREQDDREHRERPVLIVQVEQPLALAPPLAERLAQQLEADGGEEQHHLPVDLQAAQHVPRAAVEPREDEGREVPDGFLRAECAQAAAGEPAADRKGQCDDLAGDDRGRAHQDADGGPGVRPGNQPGQEWAFEREVGGPVVQQQAGDDAAGERHAEAEDEDQAIGPVAPLEDQDVPETPVAHQHRRQDGDDGELDHQRGQEHLGGGENGPLHVYLILSAG